MGHNLIMDSLKTRHRAVMRELAAGATHAEAAARTGFSASRVSELTRSPLFANELKKLMNKVEEEFVAEIASEPIVNAHRKQMESEIGKSIDTIVSLRDNGDTDGVRLRSATELLDRSGFKAVEELHAEITVDADEGLKFMLSQMVAEKKEKNGKEDKIEGEQIDATDGE